MHIYTIVWSFPLGSIGRPLRKASSSYLWVPHRDGVWVYSNPKPTSITCVYVMKLCLIILPADKIMTTSVKTLLQYRRQAKTMSNELWWKYRISYVEKYLVTMLFSKVMSFLHHFCFHPALLAERVCSPQLHHDASVQRQTVAHHLVNNASADQRLQYQDRLIRLAHLLRQWINISTCTAGWPLRHAALPR